MTQTTLCRLSDVVLGAAFMALVVLAVLAWQHCPCAGPETRFAPYVGGCLTDTECETYGVEYDENGEIVSQDC